MWRIKCAYRRNPFLPDYKSPLEEFMKNAKNLITTAIVVVTLAVLFLNATFSAAQDQKVPTKKELVTLLKTAKEPPDHLRIAAYYTREAARFRQTAKEHADLAVIYQTHPFAATGPKQGDPLPHGAIHCKKAAELALEQAKEADALAAMHKEMANTSAQKQQ